MDFPAIPDDDLVNPYEESPELKGPKATKTPSKSSKPTDASPNPAKSAAGPQSSSTPGKEEAPLIETPDMLTSNEDDENLLKSLEQDKKEKEEALRLEDQRR